MSKLATPKCKVRVYGSLVNEAGKPHKDRQSVLKTRTGSDKPRRYHMDENEAEKARKRFRSGGEFMNPYRKGGKYSAFIQALIDLGLNESHSYNDVRNAMKKIMAKQTTSKGLNSWEVFETGRASANAFVSKDLRGRILQNARVLQRLTGQHPYGWKLSQLHACIDILDNGKGLPLFRLNTNFTNRLKVLPVNDLRRKTGRKSKAAKK